MPKYAKIEDLTLEEDEIITQIMQREAENVPPGCSESSEHERRRKLLEKIWKAVANES